MKKVLLALSAVIMLTAIASVPSAALAKAVRGVGLGGPFLHHKHDAPARRDQYDRRDPWGHWGSYYGPMVHALAR